MVATRNDRLQFLLFLFSTFLFKFLLIYLQFVSFLNTAFKIFFIMNNFLKETSKPNRSAYLYFLKYLLLFFSVCGIFIHLSLTIVTNKIYLSTFPRSTLFYLIIMSTLVVIVFLFGIIHTISENIFKIPVYGLLLITLALFYLAEGQFQNDVFFKRLYVGAAVWSTCTLIVTIKFNIVISRQCTVEQRNYRLNSMASSYA